MSARKDGTRRTAGRQTCQHDGRVSTEIQVDAHQGQYSTFDYLRERYGLTVTPNECAAEMKMHPAHIRAMCNAGTMPGAFKFGDRWRIRVHDLAAFIDGEAAVM